MDHPIMTHSLVRPARAGRRPAQLSPGPRDEARSIPDFDDSSSDNDDSEEQADEWGDRESWPPDDLDLELDDEPEPEPGDFWMPDDDEE
jgi:hypothetical protein